MAVIVLEPIDRPESQLSPQISYDVDLEGRTYGIELIWYDRVERWYLQLRDDEGTYLIRGKYLAVDTPLLWRHRDTRLPPGLMVLTDLDSTGAECGYADLGTRCQLQYVTSDEVASSVQPISGIGPVAIQDP
jgi:hypothetical protein